jgi:predicted glutamine amidotransferase
VAKQPTNAYQDFDYGLAVNTFNSQTDGIVLGHLRKASKGAINYENTHPFFNEGLVFMHNGTIFFPDSTTSDSRQYFQLLQKNLHDGATLKDAFVQTMVDFKTEKIQFTSAIAFLADSSGLWVFRACSHKKDYYTVYYLKNDDHIVICQEKIIFGNWQSLANNTLMYIPWASLTPQFYPIGQ